jgi:hypothetical protein
MNQNQLEEHFKELKSAYQECWTSKIATYEIAKKHSALCIQILQTMGYVPNLINHCIDQRIKDTDGRNIYHPDFWSDANMIIALYEHLENEFGLGRN